MYATTIVATLLTAVQSVSALSGQATTTRYDDGQKGACGCGTDAGPYSWSYGDSVFYTAAGSPALFDGYGDSSWCGSGCGACYKLTSTGTAPPNDGAGSLAGQSIVVMVTNMCPYEGNEKWCPKAGTNNTYGYSYHFDLMAKDLVEVFGNNLIVDFESVACPTEAANDYGQCECPLGSMNVNAVETAQAPLGGRPKVGKRFGRFNPFKKLS